MDTFFSSVLKANFNNREHLIKQSIVERLSENIKEIQYDLKKDTGSDLESKQRKHFICKHNYLMAFFYLS